MKRTIKVGIIQQTCTNDIHVLVKEKSEATPPAYKFQQMYYR